MTHAITMNEHDLEEAVRAFMGIKGYRFKSILFSYYEGDRGEIGRVSATVQVEDKEK